MRILIRCNAVQNALRSTPCLCWEDPRKLYFYEVTQGWWAGYRGTGALPQRQSLESVVSTPENPWETTLWGAAGGQGYIGDQDAAAGVRQRQGDHLRDQ